MKNFLERFVKFRKAKNPLLNETDTLSSLNDFHNKVEISKIDLQILESKISKEYRILGERFYSKKKRAKSLISDTGLKAIFLRLDKLIKEFEDKRAQLKSYEKQEHSEIRDESLPQPKGKKRRLKKKEDLAQSKVQKRGAKKDEDIPKKRLSRKPKNTSIKKMRGKQL